MISEDLKKIQNTLKVCFEHFATFSDFFQRFRKIFKNFGNLSECLNLHSFSIEFPNTQQRRHESLLPVADRPLNFFMYIINK